MAGKGFSLISGIKIHEFFSSYCLEFFAHLSMVR